jgi:anaerobic selenocysteine-containing dehydrogenase
VEQELGVSAGDIRRVAYLFAKSPATMSLWTMGVNQRTQGTFLNNGLNSLPDNRTNWTARGHSVFSSWPAERLRRRP